MFLYPVSLPDEDKFLWTHHDCFKDKANVLVSGFVLKNYMENMHTHDFYELNLILKGKGIHYVNHNSFPIEAGDIFVIPPGFKHGYYKVEELDVYHLLIHNRFFMKYQNELEFLPGYLMLLTVEPVFRKDLNFRYFLKLDASAKEQVVDYFQRIVEECGKDEIETPTLVHSLALHAIAMICRLYREQYSIIENKEKLHCSFSSIAASIEYIQGNYTGKLTIEDLLKISHMSRTAYLRLFSKATGYTPGDYINRYRIGKARELLVESGRTIADIAQCTGFCDSSHFNRLFKKYTGLKPKVYRELVTFHT